MNIDTLSKFEDVFSPESLCAAMIDYHYCSHDIKDYPKYGESKLEVLRLTSRKQDFDEALKFAEHLKDSTGLQISFQIINSTNYNSHELHEITSKLCDTNLDIVAYADSHGNLNLFNDYVNFEPSISELKSKNKKIGFHLHNHTGRALSNFLYLSSKKIDYIDASVNGIGKGLGNLMYEEIIRNEDLPILLNYMTYEAHEAIRIDKWKAYNILTGRSNVTDNYSKEAVKYDHSFVDFFNIISRLAGIDKDSYNPDAYKKILEGIG